jgi:hypothetical protein
MKHITYRVIFGENWGSGHLNRAIAFASNVQEPVELQIILECESDRAFADKYGVAYTDCAPDSDFGDCDLAIDDTLGLFVPQAVRAKAVWIIDALHAADRTAGPATTFWSLLYPDAGAPFPAPSMFFKRPVPCAAVFQGGADDHRQIETIIDKLPREHRLLVGVGSNCRHTARLQDLCKERGAAAVLVDFDVVRIARAADYVITSGGNILFELLYNAEPRNLVLYSREAKEHLTFAQVSGHERIVHYVRFEEGFAYHENYLRNITRAEHDRLGLLELEALCRK